MKIVLATHHFLPRFDAGAEQYAYRIAQALRHQGHEVEVVCIESITEGSLTPACRTEIYDDLTVHRLYFDLGQAPSQLEWSFRNPELGRWFETFLAHSHPDVVHVNSGYLLGGSVPETAFRRDIPTALTLHDYWFVCPLITLLRRDGKTCEGPVPPARCVWCSLSHQRRYHWPDRGLDSRLGDAFVSLCRSETMTRALGVAPRLDLIQERRSYLRRILEGFDVVISPSHFLIQKMDEYGFTLRRSVYLPFGLDPAHLSSTQPRTHSVKLRIGYLGQFVPDKGVHLLLDAFQRLVKSHRSCELILHGHISGASAYERKLLQTARRDPAITFAGPYPNYQVGQVLRDLDVIVVPSMWYENRPTVIVEAHATQTPVVAARLGGMAELVTHDQNGLLFEVGSVQALAEQLQRLLDEPTLLPHLRRGIQPVPMVEVETATLVNVYSSLLSNCWRASSTR